MPLFAAEIMLESLICNLEYIFNPCAAECFKIHFLDLAPQGLPNVVLQYKDIIKRKYINFFGKFVKISKEWTKLPRLFMKNGYFERKIDIVLLSFLY